jgi:hypothetical protein
MMDVKRDMAVNLSRHQASAGVLSGEAANIAVVFALFSTISPGGRR